MSISNQEAIFIGPWGADGGNYWNDGIYDGVKKIRLGHGECINSIQIEYEKDGQSVWCEKHGGPGGIPTEIQLNPGSNEYLKGVSGHYSSPAVDIRSLTFILSTNRNCGPYGSEETGTSFSVPMEGGKIVGFAGSSGEYVNSLGIYVKRD